MRFINQVALITGAASGIGRACAQRFAEEGANVVLVDWSADGLAHTSASLSHPERHMSQQLDVSDEQAVAQLVEDVIARFGQIDVLCNNAGVAGSSFSPISQQNPEDWQRILGVNLMGPMFLSQYVSRHMIERRQGAIVNTASVAGIRSGAGGNAYSASKAALINLTQTSACDLGEFNIRVNAVCPGLVETGMTQPIFDLARAKGKEDKLGARAELRRFGKPSEVAAAIAFLASADASFITGQALAVDGGNSASLNMPGMKL